MAGAVFRLLARLWSWNVATKIFKKTMLFFGASKALAKTRIPGTWRDPHEFGLWPIAQIVNPCTGEAKGHVAAGLSNHRRQRVCVLGLRVQGLVSRVQGFRFGA